MALKTSGKSTPVARQCTSRYNAGHASGSNAGVIKCQRVKSHRGDHGGTKRVKGAKYTRTWKTGGSFVS